jgi:hypothetical protein
VGLEPRQATTPKFRWYISANYCKRIVDGEVKLLLLRSA